MKRIPIDELRTRIHAAITDGNAEALHECAFELEMRQLGRTRFLRDNLELVLEVIADPRFHRMEGGVPLLMLFAYDAEKLSRPQRVRVLETLASHYRNFGDWMVRFYVTELVGKKFGNRAALAMFDELAKSDDPEGRQFIPHGYEHLVSDGDPELRDEALARLQAMQDDPSELVRYEVQLSLERLARENVRP